MKQQPHALKVELIDINDTDDLAPSWLDLQSRAAASYFTSWGWIGCWLRHLPASVRPQLLHARLGASTVGLAVIVRRRIWRQKIFPSNALFLNETGDPRFDHLTLEHNGILVDTRVSYPVVPGCIRFLLDHDPHWDELVLNRVSNPGAFRYAIPPSSHAALLHDAVRPCHYVDLTAVKHGDDYLARLSANTRYQLRRSLRQYERQGDLTVEAARSAEEADAFLGELKSLHQAYWRQKGRGGAFANPFFERFHRSLIADRFACGEIQLLRIRAGTEPIGYLYNLLLDGHVCNYQSGFVYSDKNSVKPGFVSHYLAILHNLRAGARLYDFLASDDRYKRSLGTHSREMVSLCVQRKRVKFRLGRRLRRLKQRLLPPRAPLPREDAAR